MERMNQELEQYLRMYIDYRQNNWSEWLATTKFTFNNKVYTSTKSLLFKINYRREPRMDFDIRKKEKNMKVEEFVKEMKNKHEKTKAALVKSQEEIKRTRIKKRQRNIEWKIKC